MNNAQNISGMFERGLCNQCGACVAICKQEAIKMACNENGEYIPIVDDERCSNCGICYEICPGHSVDFISLKESLFGSHSEDPLTGYIRSCYITYSTDDAIRRNSSSGGTATALLIYALENNIIDGALIVRFSKEDPLVPEAIIARSKEDILSASGSKYFPVPLLTGLKEILLNDGRYAVVGLPCHIHALRKTQKVDKRLSDKIVFTIGLYCGYCLSYSATEFLIDKLYIDKKEVTKMGYRAGSGMGGFFVEMKNGEQKIIPKRDYSYLHGFFSPIRCTTCIDQTNELADISLGDTYKLCYNLGISSPEETNLTICRSEVGESIIKDAVDENYLRSIEIDKEQILSFQMGNKILKKETVKARMKLLSRRSRDSPHYSGFDVKNNSSVLATLDLMGAALWYLNIKLSSKKLFRRIMLKFPFFFKYYSYFVLVLLQRWYLKTQIVCSNGKMEEYKEVKILSNPLNS